MPSDHETRRLRAWSANPINFILRFCGIATLALECAPAQAIDAYKVYVSDEISGDVTVINGATHVVEATFPVGKRPRGIHLSPDGRTLYVATSGSPRLGPGADAERARDTKADKSADGIAVVDLASRRVVRRISVGSDPEEFAISPDGTRLIVSNEDEAQASCWDLATGKKLFATPVSPEPEGVAIHPNGREIYITCEERGDIFVLNAERGTPIAQFHLRGRPRSVSFARNGERAFIPAEGEAEVSVVDTAAHRVITAIKIEGADVRPMGSVASRNGREVFISTGRGNLVAVIDSETNTVVARIPVGQRPWGIALNPGGTTLYSANGLSGDVSVIDVATRKETARIKAGAGPWGIAIARR